MGTNVSFQQCLLYLFMRSKQKDIIIKLQKQSLVISVRVILMKINPRNA